MGDTPDLDWVYWDLYCDYLTSVLTLDALVGRGVPSADVCGCCATRMRERRRSHVSAGRSRVYRICGACDRQASDLWPPKGWA